MSPVLYVAFEEKKYIFSPFNVAQVCIGRLSRVFLDTIKAVRHPLRRNRLLVLSVFWVRKIEPELSPESGSRAWLRGQIYKHMHTHWEENGVAKNTRGQCEFGVTVILMLHRL